jgi:hypothetical protein
MKRSAAALLVLSCAAIAAWSTPKPAYLTYSNVGCGADSGKSILVVDFLANTSESWVLKSNSPIYPLAASIFESSVSEQLPIQLFTRTASDRVDFSYVGDDGTCHTKNWIEVIGVGISKK